MRVETVPPLPQSLTPFISNFILQISKSSLLEEQCCGFPFLSVAISTQHRAVPLKGQDSNLLTGDDSSLAIYVPNLLTWCFLLFCKQMLFSQKCCFLASVSYLWSFKDGPSSLLSRELVYTFLSLERFSISFLCV